MSLNTRAILMRLREVIEGGGSFRTISSTRFFARGSHEAKNASGQAVDAAERPNAIVNVRVRRGPGPLQPASIDILAIDVRVLVIRQVDPATLTDADTLDEFELGPAGDDADLLKQVLEGPDNLTTTTGGGGLSTGIVSSSLQYVDSDEPRQLTGGPTGRRIQTSHRFSGFVTVSQSV